MDALQQLNLAAPITDTYTMIESMIIQRIAAQIAGNPQGLINNSSEWRIQMLARMGKLSADTAKIIASQTKGIGYDIEAAINASVQSVLQTHDLTMTDKLSGNIRSALTMYDRQAISGKYNQVNTVMQYKAKQTYLKAVDGTVSRFERIMQKELDNKQEYLDVLNKNAMAVTLGERSRTEAIRATIEEMSDKGIPAFIDASGREWSAEAYVNMDIRNTVKNAANATQFACIEELGQDIVLVSSHAGARPLCAPYQGKFYSMSGKSGTIRDAHGKEYHYEPWSSTSYGEAAGLLGINCGHSIRGVSDGMFINREKQYDEKENSEEYDKVVKQRELERKIRKQKTTRNALKAAGDDEGVKEYDRKIKASTAQLEAYCDKNGLTMRRDRTEVYGYSDPGRKIKREDFVETVAPKKPTFVPAGSIEEAESFAKSIGIRHVDYSDLPLETANLLNEAALTLPEDARPAFVGSGNNLQKVTGAKFSRSSKDYYGVHLDAQDFHFGEYPNIEYDFDGGQAVGISNYYKTADKIEKSKIKGNVEYAKRHDGHTQFFNTDGRSTGFHEMGHIYDDVKGIPEGFIKDAERWAAESKCDMLNNPHEAWAEAWGAYHTQNPDLPDYIAKYVHERTNTPIDNFGKSDIIKENKLLYPDTLAGVKRGKPMTHIKADSGNVNPHYGEKGFDKNCQSCTIVYEARRRGFDVEASPCLQGSMAERLANQYTLAWIDPKTGKRPGYIKDNSMDSPSKYLDYMKRTINPNERYVIGFSWKGKGNGGHIVNLDLDDNGEIRITDNQRGEHERREYLGDKAVLKYLKQMKWSETISGYKMPKVPKMLRIDNLQFEPDVAKKIMKERE